MSITSPVFQSDNTIPSHYTCEGLNVNPPLHFSNIPSSTKSLVLVIEDKDAGNNPWIHWLVYNIPPTATRFEEQSIPHGAVEGICNGGTYGYEGPCPRYFNGTHHYVFHLYALDKALSQDATMDYKMIGEKMKGHIIEEATLTGIAKGAKHE